MYRIVAVCHGLGLAPSKGEQTARDVTADFATDEDVSAQCEWNGSDLILRADVDYDEDGVITLDYFRKCIEASCGAVVGAGVYLESIEELHDNA
jgi:hypothetical protein